VSGFSRTRQGPPEGGRYGDFSHYGNFSHYGSFSHALWAEPSCIRLTAAFKALAVFPLMPLRRGYDWFSICWKMICRAPELSISTTSR
jgi:hypothetical protein